MKPRPEEVGYDVPPALTISPDDQRHNFRVNEGESFNIKVSLFNTGHASVGLALYITGDAVSGSFVRPGIVEADFAGLMEPLEADLLWGRISEEYVLEARLWEKPPGGAPPPPIVPAGLTIAPPFLYRDLHERAWAMSHWQHRLIGLSITLVADSAGHTELELWAVPPENPTEGVMITAGLTILPT